jgi:hypothetical protein
MSSFSLPVALGISTLPPAALDLINTKCTSPENSLLIIKEDSSLFELLINNLPENFENVDKPLLCKVLQVAEGNSELPSALLTKINNAAPRLIYAEAYAELSQKVNEFSQEFNKSPSIPKFRKQLLDVLVLSNLNRPYIPANSIYAYVEKCLMKLSFNPSKVLPSLSEVVNAVFILRFNEAMIVSEVVQGDPKVKTFQSMTSLIATLNPSQQKNVNSFLQDFFVQRFKAINVKFTTEPEIGIPSINKELDQILTIIKDLNLPLSKAGKEEIIKLEKAVCEKFFTLFKHVDQVLTLDSAVIQKINDGIYFCMKLIACLDKNHQANDLDSNWKIHFETSLFKHISTTFTLNLCQVLSTSLFFTSAARSIIRSIAEFLILLDKETFSLEEFVSCCGKVYLNILPFRKDLTQNGNDFIIGILISVLRSCMMQAASNDNMTEKSLDLNKLKDLQLKRRLSGLLKSFAALLGGEIELQLKMKITHDSLIALLFQLLCPRFKNTLPGIQEWVNKHPDYHFADFHQWLIEKIKLKAKLKITRDPEVLYFQFVAQNATKKG